MGSEDERVRAMREDEDLGEETSATPPTDAGRGEAVARLFSDHNASLIRFLRLRLNSEQEARDVAQEAYVRLLQLDEPGAVGFLRAYLFRTAANLATDRLRRKVVRRQAHVDPVFEEEDLDNRDPERTTVARQQLAIIRAGLDELPEKVRTAFLLHRLSGLSVVEVGQRMGFSERTARNYVIQAMVHCRRLLDVGEPMADKRDQS
jgi:RNA polymerase sigma factor (sigma-70 family)